MDETDKPALLFPEPAEPQPGPAPGILEQVLGVFTEPVPLFRRLADQPRWGRALAVVMAMALAAGLVWSARVDADALLRPVLAADPRVRPDQLEGLIALQGRLLGAMQALAILVLVPAVTVALAGCYWLVARFAGSSRPRFAQALCVAVVPNLVQLPKSLLVIVLCLVQEVGGRTPEQMVPLSLGAWLGPDRGWQGALLAGFDLFALAWVVLLFLAARHVLRLGTAAALACAAMGAAVTAGFLVLGGR